MGVKVEIKFTFGGKGRRVTGDGVRDGVKTKPGREGKGLGKCHRIG